jgi:hypothetical protein
MADPDYTALTAAWQALTPLRRAEWGSFATFAEKAAQAPPDRWEEPSCGDLHGPEEACGPGSSLAYDRCVECCGEFPIEALQPDPRDPEALLCDECRREARREAAIRAFNKTREAE